MTDQNTLFPLEFFVTSTPISLQASGKSRERWKATVKEAANQRVREIDELGFLDRRPLALTLYYFPVATMRGDIDNIVKPIMDALINVAYLDDKEIERLVIQKFDPEVARDFVDPSDQLLTALEAVFPVLYVRLDDDLSWRVL